MIQAPKTLCLILFWSLENSLFSILGHWDNKKWQDEPFWVHLDQGARLLIFVERSVKRYADSTKYYLGRAKQVILARAGTYFTDNYLPFSRSRYYQLT